MNTGRIALVVVRMGAALCILFPFLLTRGAFWGQLNFSKTGDIGSTIGGATAPIIGLTSAILLFLALRAQIVANGINERHYREDRESQNLNDLYGYVRDSINNFKFRVLDGYIPITQETSKGKEKLLKGEKKVAEVEETLGTHAFASLFHQINCNYHGDVATLKEDPSVAELQSILISMNLLLDKLGAKTSEDAHILKALLEQQFFYRVITSLKNRSVTDLKSEYCGHCKRNHGIPDEILSLITQISTKLGKPFSTS